MMVLPVLFRTLRSVGYQECAHPRRGRRDGRCCDCGASLGPADTMEGGSLDYVREPLAGSHPVSSSSW